MKKFLSIFFLIAGIVAAIYFGGWLLFAKPIWMCCIAFDAGTLTAVMVGITFFKCCVAGLVATICIFVGGLVFGLLN